MYSLPKLYILALVRQLIFFYVVLNYRVKFIIMEIQ